LIGGDVGFTFSETVLTIASRVRLGLVAVGPLSFLTAVWEFVEAIFVALVGMKGDEVKG
jgi:hypothetical protein